MELNSILSVGASLYIDASAVSILLTSISGVIIAVGATAVILWRRFRKGVAKVLKIDENANKEVEDEVIIVDDEVAENPTAEETAEETAAEESANESENN